MARFAGAGIDVGTASDPAELAATCRGWRRRADADTALATLLALAPGDPMAALTALVALGPVLKSVATRSDRARRDDTAQADVLAIAWEVVASPSPGRSAKEVIAAVWNRRRTEARRSYARQTVEQPLDGIAEPEAPDTDPAACVSTLLHDALRRGVVTERQAALVYETRIVGRPATEIARSSGRSNTAVWKERDRTEAAFRHFVTSADADVSAGTGR